MGLHDPRRKNYQSCDYLPLACDSDTPPLRKQKHYRKPLTPSASELAKAKRVENPRHPVLVSLPRLRG